MAVVAGQEKLIGIFRRLGDNHNWNISLLRTAYECTASRISELIANGCDGFIVSIPSLSDAYAPLACSSIPTVVLDIHVPSLTARTRNIVFVRNSPDAIGRAAADHLLSTGRCRSYAFVHNPAVIEWSIERFRAFPSSFSSALTSAST